MAESDASCTLDEAASIMGNNFHGPEDVKKHLGISVRQGGFYGFQPVSIRPEELEAFATTDVLVAAVRMSIMDVYSRASHTFYFEGEDADREPWFSDYGQRRAFTNETISPGWHLISKEAPEGSLRDSKVGPRAVVGDGASVPKANLAVYAWVLHFLATGECMFADNWVRTSSSAQYDPHVDLLGSSGGLYVDDGHRYDPDRFGEPYAWRDYPHLVGTIRSRQLPLAE